MTEAELSELREWAKELRDPCHTSGSNRMGELLAKLLAEARDAARYRYLRDCSDGDVSGIPNTVIWQTSGDGNERFVRMFLWGEKMDAAVDAAMARSALAHMNKEPPAQHHEEQPRA